MERNFCRQFMLAVLVLTPIIALQTHAVSALQQEFQLDSSGSRVAFLSGNEKELVVQEFPEGKYVYRSTMYEAFPENTRGARKDDTTYKFSQMSFHPSGECLAFAGSGAGRTLYAGIVYLPSERAIGLHVGGWKRFSFSPDGKWLITSDFTGSNLTAWSSYPHGAPILQSNRSDDSFFFSADGKLVAVCCSKEEGGKKFTEIQIVRLENDVEIVRRIEQEGNARLEIVKRIRFGGEAKDLRISPDNSWLLWKGWPTVGTGNRPFVARISGNENQIQEVEFAQDMKFWGDVCFAGSPSNYFILAHKTGEIKGKNHVSLWKQSLDLDTPAERIFEKVGNSHYPIAGNREGTHVLMGIEIRVGKGYGLVDEVEAASLRGSQFFLIDLNNMKEVWAFPMNESFARFHPTRSTVVVRDGDRFSEYDFAGNPVANRDTRVPAEARTKR